MISNKPSKEILDEMMRVAESIFGTKKDPDQMPITMDSWNKLQTLNKNCVLYEIDESGKLISWIVVMPTNKELMDKFLKGKITEKGLLQKTKPEEKYSALYLCSAITKPEHRMKGYAKKLTMEAVVRIPKTDDYALFAWPTTEEGKVVVKKFNSELGRKIFVKS